MSTKKVAKKAKRNF